MTDSNRALAKLDAKADRIIGELGLDPGGPPEQLTFETGFQLGSRFKELLPIDQEVVDDLVGGALGEMAALFPSDPNPELIEFQSYFLGPLVSVFLTGRGLTVSEMATLAAVPSRHTYRLNRKGLSIIFAPKDPTFRTGVNRRFSGRDDRKTYLTLDYQGFATKPWPKPLSEVRPFLRGLLAGLKSWLDDQAIRAILEPSLNIALSKLLSDPELGNLFDGLVMALQRIAQGLREKVLTMVAEKDRVLRFEKMLVELTGQRERFLSALAEAGNRLSNPGPAALSAPKA
jgi:hypothetical protein